MDWYLKVLKDYATFEGRARRKEFWMFAFFNGIVIIALTLIELITGIPGFLSGLYSLGVLLPTIAVSVRRLHDIGKSGWWYLISLIPIVGSIVLFVFFCLEGHEEQNDFGVNPKNEVAA